MGKSSSVGIDSQGSWCNTQSLDISGRHSKGQTTRPLSAAGAPNDTEVVATDLVPNEAQEAPRILNNCSCARAEKDNDANDAQIAYRHRTPMPRSGTFLSQLCLCRAPIKKQRPRTRGSRVLPLVVGLRHEDRLPRQLPGPINRAPIDTATHPKRPTWDESRPSDAELQTHPAPPT